jgi:hypothetical protein
MTKHCMSGVLLEELKEGVLVHSPDTIVLGVLLLYSSYAWSSRLLSIVLYSCTVHRDTCEQHRTFFLGWRG